MFDNCLFEMVCYFVIFILDYIKIEVLGGIMLKFLFVFKGMGVNYILLGFLIYFVKSLDISMDVILLNEFVEECCYVNF